MTYELAILTHGRSEPLRATLASFREHVRPLPDRIRVFADGARDLAYAVGAVRGALPEVEDPEVHAPSSQRGFCGATGALWRACAELSECDYVFWLEHDFLIERSVHVEQLADLLEHDRNLAQVALVRNAVNVEEKRAGGLIRSRPGTFLPRHTLVCADGVRWDVAWLEHRAFFTTNPSLMRRDFMRENPWLDDGQSQCEGRYGLRLIEDGFRFAYWGDGIPWVRHVGERNGTGY